MNINDKDKIISEQLSDLSDETLRFMVVDLMDALYSIKEVLELLDKRGFFTPVSCADKPTLEDMAKVKEFLKSV